jgi:hypothetical protein
MTVQPSMGNEVAPFDPAEFGNVGMEDVGATDLVIPRLQIVHKEGVFRDNLSKSEYSTLQVILLGLVKQRIMWDEDVEEGDRPQCKSPDFNMGFPQMREDIPKAKQFPWDMSNFSKADFPPEAGVNGLRTLPCDRCVFNQWTKNARTGKSEPPLCSEQHSYPLLYSADEGQSWTTAIATFQRTGIKPSKNYISSFMQQQLPMFTSVTELSLSVQTRGTVTFSVPIFRRLGATDRNLWNEYANSYRTLRQFLHTPPRNQSEDDAPVASDNTNTAPSQSSFSTPPQAAAPAEVPPQTPVAEPAPAPQAAAPAPQPAAPAPQPATPPPPGPATPPPSDLPF